MFKHVLIIITLILSLNACVASRPDGAMASCVFPDTPSVLAPAWICDQPVKGIKVSAVGSAKKSAAGIKFMKAMASTDARVSLTQKMRKMITRMIIQHGEAMGQRDSDDVINAINASKKYITNETMHGTKIFKTRISPNGVLYVLIGLSDKDVVNIAHNAKKNNRTVFSGGMANIKFGQLIGGVNPVSMRVTEQEKKVNALRDQQAEAKRKETEKQKALDAERKKVAEQKRIATLIKSQKCKLKDSNWIYLGSACKSGYAHGQGEAIMLEKNLKYDGVFKNGMRTKGKLFVNNSLMYDGGIRNGRPSGSGICIYKEEPERCEFYNGKRVDAIYKQRIAFVDQQRILDEKLAKIERSQQAQLNNMQNQINSTRRTSPGSSTGGGKGFGDVVAEKATQAVINKLFDRLF